jgi:hypothetical protein
VIPSQGMYGRGDSVRVAYRTDDLAKAKAKAAKLTREYQDSMRKYGGTSGGYRVVAWDSGDKTISFGHDADRMTSL